MGLSYIPGYYIESNYIHTTNKMPKGSGLTKPEPQRRAGRSHRRQEGREAVQTRGGQEAVGLHQGEDQSLRHGQVPQGPPDFIDDDATPGIISILALRPLSLSLSISATLSLKVKTNPSCAGVLFE